MECVGHLQYHNCSGIRVTNKYEWCIWRSRTVNQTGVAERGVAVVPVVTVPAKGLNDKERRVTERLMWGEPEKRAREGGIREVTIFFDILKFRGWHSPSLHVLGGIPSDSILVICSSPCSVWLLPLAGVLR